MTTNTKASISLQETPTLFDDVLSMFIGSISTPAIANIRILARKGKLPTEDAKEILSLPLILKDAVKLILRNKEVLLQEFSHDKGVPVHVLALEALMDSKYEPFWEVSTLQVFDDDHSESELVYAIAISPGRKRIVLTFRGSITRKDYTMGVNYLLREEPNPVASEKSQSQGVGIHNGYCSFLCEETTANGDKKIDQILAHLEPLMNENPDYHLYIAGHSMGGSLASLMAYKTASLPLAEKIPAPITCISYGTTRVGDLRFCRAFQALEEQNLIRCLRVINDGDIVPLMPYRGGKFVSYLLRCKSNAYRHVGDELRLYHDKDKYSVAHPPEAKSYVGAYLKDLPNRAIASSRLLPWLILGKTKIEHHSAHDYLTNICNTQDKLTQLSLDDVTTKRRTFSPQS